MAPTTERHSDRALTADDVRERLARSRPAEEHFVFDANAAHWARYLSDMVRRYGGRGMQPAEAGAYRLRQGRRVGGYHVVSVDHRVAERLRETVDGIWCKYLGCARAFARRTELREGTEVESRYRRRWRGRVFGPGFAHAGCVTVLVTHDASGRPQRRPYLTEIDAAWLREVA